ncbi:MAG: pyridoxal-phosphate dependent enzyme [Opitutales bacterium]|nr:pyridoxal-phosphate dependent enzyme [Opitutales bacterium]
MSELSDKLLNAILMARQSVYAVSKATPTEELVGTGLPFRLFVKREDLGPIKAYKWRGAYNRMVHLDPEERSRGVVTASAGNHAQGVALAAKRLGIHAKIFMPLSTPLVKQEAVKRFGGDFVEIVLFGDSYSEAGDEAKKYSHDKGLTFVHPYDDLLVMGGQGTLADEAVMSGEGPFDVAYLQIGGGGMAAATAVWLKNQFPGIKVYGVEGVRQASMKAALERGEPYDIGPVDIFCDGTAVRKAGSLTFELCKEFLDEIVTVTNEEVCTAIQKLWESNRIIPETSGAMGVAAALKEAGKLAGKKVFTVISGANADFGKLRVITRSAHISGHKNYALRIDLPERPGSLLAILQQCFKGVSITEFQYGKTSSQIASPVIGVSLDDATFEKLKSSLDAAGVRWTDATRDPDVVFRVIPFEKDLLRFPTFLQVNFRERANGLREFMTACLGERDNLCYFNYFYTGETVGRALIGIESDSPELREDLHRRLTGTLKGVQTYTVLSGDVAKRLGC